MMWGLACIFTINKQYRKKQSITAQIVTVKSASPTRYLWPCGHVSLTMYPLVRICIWNNSYMPITGDGDGRRLKWPLLRPIFNNLLDLIINART